MIDFGYWLFATATVITHVFIALLLLMLLLRKNKKIGPVYEFFAANKVNFVFASSFIATLGSLFFSEIAHFAPCILCWFQRIFMYPQAVLSYLAIMRGESRFLVPYLLVLNMVGILFSAYHNFILWFPQYAELVSCSTKGGPSCIEGYTFYYGYITIPMMALTVFGFNILVLTAFRDRQVSKKKLVN